MVGFFWIPPCVDAIVSDTKARSLQQRGFTPARLVRFPKVNHPLAFEARPRQVHFRACGIVPVALGVLSATQGRPLRACHDSQWAVTVTANANVFFQHQLTW